MDMNNINIQNKRFFTFIRKLSQAYQLFEQVSDKNVRKMGLTPGQFDVIATLGNQPPMTCKDLAEKTLMVKGNLTVILDGLLKRGLIEKTSNPLDARSIIIMLTKDGENIFNDVFYQQLEYFNPLAIDFDDHELNQLEEKLEYFTDKVNKFCERG